MTKKPVTLPKFSFDPDPPGPSPRETAEHKLVEAIRDSVDIIEFYLSELTQTANPTRTFRNRIQQKDLMRALETLCHCVVPPLRGRSHFKPQPKVKIKGPIRMCTSCGGPGRIEYKTEWYCQDCCPEDSPYKKSERRRERAREIRAMEHEAIMMGNAITSVERAVRRAQRHSRYTKQAPRDLETGGRQENHGLGSEAAHQPSASDLGDAEG
jgi:hypothetical protein